MLRASSILVVIAAWSGACSTAPDSQEAVCLDSCDDSALAEPARLRDHLLDGLRDLSHRDATLFGQQAFNIHGVSPGPWKAAAGSVDRSDVDALVGRHPAVLGLDVWNLAIKPENWDVRPSVHAEAAREVFRRGGVVTMSWHMRGCDRSEEGDAFWAAGNEECLCRLANDDSYAQAWLKDGKLARFADALERYQLDELPIVFRPLHEHTGSWFWWGREYWSCPGMKVQGEDAFRRVFQTIVDYLRVERGLDNLLIAYSPDRLESDGLFDFSSLGERYLRGYPGDDYVDVLGIDLYYQAGSDHDDETDEFREYLEQVTRMAHARQKVAALTEVGNLDLMQEGLTGNSHWYEQHLLSLLRDPGVQLAYALTWDNRSVEASKFFVPTGEHPGVSDFRRFVDADESLLLGQGPSLYEPADIEYPTCHRCTSDRDGDGWGWEQQRSCVLASWCLGL